VAHLRNLYALAPIEEAIERFNGLVRTGLKLAADAPLPPATQSLESKPLLTLALATLADAWANRTVQWRKIPPVAEPPVMARLSRVIAEHRQHVKAITDVVQAVLDTISGIKRTVAAAAPGQAQVSAQDQEKASVWDSDTLRQVEWAKCNALGDFYLYAAVEANKLAVEYPVVRLDAAFKDLDVEHLIDDALEELRKCEMLLPAGVETLSNIGTLYLERGKAGDLPLARQYLRRAITLNPHYEYAYYRLAQSWEREQWRERVVETLKSWPMPPQIGSFRRMFTKYFVQPKAEYPSDADSEDDA
jgi:tetratricopeptide (TPR) repeat protein